MSAEEIRETLSELREAGRHLRRRHAGEVLDALGQVLELWRDPGSPPRDALAKQLPEATGFSEPVVREGLARGLEPWSRAALLALVDEELGGRAGLEQARGFDVTATVLAGSIPMPTLLSLVAPRVLRSPVLAKPASRDPVTAGLVRKSLAMVDPELADCVALVDFAREDEASRAEFLEAGCAVVSGDDDTLATFEREIAPPRRLVGHGHRVSVAALGPRAGSGPDLARAAEALALDVCLWDQEGCLSPVALYVVGDPAAARRAGEAVAEALAAAESRLPRGRLGPDALAHHAQERESAELRAAAGDAVALHAGATSCVVVEADARPRPAPLGRFVRVHPAADAPGLAEALAPLAPQLAAVGHAGFAEPPALPGAPRLCGLGELQAPPLGWRRDGHGVLLSVAQESR